MAYAGDYVSTRYAAGDATIVKAEKGVEWVFFRIVMVCRHPLGVRSLTNEARGVAAARMAIMRRNGGRHRIIRDPDFGQGVALRGEVRALAWWPERFDNHKYDDGYFNKKNNFHEKAYSKGEQNTNYYKKRGWYHKKSKSYQEKWSSDRGWFDGSPQVDSHEKADLLDERRWRSSQVKNVLGPRQENHLTSSDQKRDYKRDNHETEACCSLASSSAAQDLPKSAKKRSAR